MTTNSTKKPKRKADLKVVIVGERNVGKTSLIHRYLDRQFNDTISTLGATFLLKQWGEYKVAIWDTAGEERYVGLTSFYFRGARAAILAFDPCDAHSFEILQSRFVPLLDAAEEYCLKVVVGTKLDLVTPATRQVMPIEGQALAKMLNPDLTEHIPYFETSSLEGTKVDETFEFIFKCALLSDPKMENGPSDKLTESITLHKPIQTSAENEEKTKCC